MAKVLDSDDGYNKYAKYYDKDWFFLDSFERGELFHLLGDLRGKKVLDVGCGSGRIIADLRKFGATVVAADISESMVHSTKKKFPDIEVIISDVADMPFEDNSFDFVIATFLIVHLKFLEPAFNEVNRVLKPGGSFILTNINQRKSPKLKVGDKEEIVIKSFYHRPQNVLEDLESSLFSIDKEKFIYEGKTWINQLVKAVK
jgi:ubiquinone/menaquinone biosynthesis C-methylase UbiE